MLNFTSLCYAVWNDTSLSYVAGALTDRSKSRYLTVVLSIFIVTIILETNVSKNKKKGSLWEKREQKAQMQGKFASDTYISWDLRGAQNPTAEFI